MTIDDGSFFIKSLDETYKKDPNSLDKLISITQAYINNDEWPFSIDKLKIEIIQINTGCSEYDSDLFIYSLENEEYFQHLIHISPDYIKKFLFNFRTLFSSDICRVKQYIENPFSLFKILTISNKYNKNDSLVRFIRADKSSIDIFINHNFYLMMIDYFDNILAKNISNFDVQFKEIIIEKLASMLNTINGDK